MVKASSANTSVVTADAGVAQWATGRGYSVISEHLGELADSDGYGLDRAARAVVRSAGDRPWAIVHADLPIVTAADFIHLWDVLDTHATAIAPSCDGGHLGLASAGPWRFEYGQASFHRHQRTQPTAAVVTVPGLRTI